MTKKELARRYVSGNYAKGKASHCSFEGDIFYSYATAICRRISDRLYLISTHKYSNTTTSQTNALKSEIPASCQILIPDILVTAGYYELEEALAAALEDARLVANAAVRIVAAREAQEEYSEALRSLKALQENKDEIIYYTDKRDR